MGLMLAATFTLTNCAKEIDAPVQESESAGIPFEIMASAVDTKTTNDGLSTVWAEGDALNLFHAEAGATTEDYIDNGEFTYGVTENGNFSGTLAGELTAATYDWYASYPYNKYITTPASTTSGYMTIGSSATGAQTQTGNNSMAHIAGANYPLYGVVKNVPAGDTPVITMNHLSSLIEVNVYNEVGEDIIVSSISFTAPENVVGTFYVDFTGETLGLKDSGTSYVSTTATLNVVDGEAIVSDGDPAKFYLAVKPFTAVAESTMTVKVTLSDERYQEYSKSYNADVVFNPGKIKKINVYVTEPNDPAPAPEYTLPYEETFGSSLGEFTAEGDLPTGLSYVWAYDSSYGAKASAYVSGTRYEQESYLVSPILNLEGVENAKMSFDHTGRYFGTKTDEATLWVRPVGGEWEQLTISTYFSNNDWTFVNSGEIDLSAYAGEKIQIGFKYTSTSTVAGTWEIKNVKVEEGTVTPVIMGVENPETIAYEGADVTVTYSIVNPVEGVLLTATKNVEWITDIDCSVAGKVSFKVAANDGSTRSGDVKLSYTGAEDVIVVVAQSANPNSGETTVTTIIGELGLTDATKYTTLELDEVITATATGTTNTGKYYNNGANWRLYQNENPSLTISADDGYTIKSVKITYVSNKTGVLTYNASNIASETVVDVNASSITFGVGNTGTATNGQVRISEIEVAYQAN